MVIEMAGRHDRTGWMDELEHRLAPPDDGNLGPLPLEGVVDDHVDAEVVEVRGETPGKLGQRPGLNFWDHLECSGAVNYAKENIEQRPSLKRKAFYNATHIRGEMTTHPSDGELEGGDLVQLGLTSYHLLLRSSKYPEKDQE